MVQIANQLLSALTVVAQLLVVVAVVLFLFFRNKNNPLVAWFSKNGLIVAFIAALIATAGSLFYSEIAGYDPCKLCWFQRILMYPQVLLLGLALIKKQGRLIADYGILLSVVGAPIAAYHYLLQIGVAPSVACDVVGYSASCAQRFVMHFGYITIPMMALSAFLLIIASLYFYRKQGD